MVFNAAGLLAVVEVAFRPHLLVPRLVVEDIRALKLQSLKARGVVGVVLDKDNCLTKPKNDALVPELQEAWPALVETFGRENVLIVSNSAGTRDDAGFLQAESVSRHLGVPVLLHATKKPGCARAVQDYFIERLGTDKTGSKVKSKVHTLDQIALDVATASTLSSETPSAPLTSAAAINETSPTKTPVIMIIGDRVMTDVILANRMNKRRWRQSSSSVLQALPVLTTRLWQKEGFGTRFMRTLEMFAMRRASAYYSRRHAETVPDWYDCVTARPEPTTVLAALPVPSANKKIKQPIYQYFSKEHFKSMLSRISHKLLNFVGRITAPVIRRIEPFLNEARQAQFGFRIPQTYQKTKLLRDILDGRRPITTRK